jgi:glycosyltransferase involved in cell wall biosynthesis
MKKKYLDVKCPFFSVCIPLFNRGRTIFSTLASLSYQEFKDFEVKIVVYNCSDNTLEEVYRFFNSDIYKFNKFNYEIKISDKNYDDWNGPVNLATGKYIAMLEGDDRFLPKHLSRAFKLLSTNRNVGVYSTGNQYRQREREGLIGSIFFFKYIYSMIAIPPPSETIFIRINENLGNYLYNHKSFVYAPEIDLYLRIANDGYDAYYDTAQTVWRYPPSYKQSSWIYFHDYFVILKKYKNHKNVSKKIFNETSNLIIYRSLESYLRGIVSWQQRTYDFKRNLIKELGFVVFYKHLTVLIFNMVIRLFKKKLKIKT